MCSKTIPIRIRRETVEELKKLKLYPRETYDDVIRRLIANMKVSQEEWKEVAKEVFHEEEEKTAPRISQTVSGIPKRKVVGPSESIERPSEVEEEIPPEVPPEEVLSTEESSEKYERVEDEIVEEFLEGRGEPTIGDKIVSILYERAREPKELMRMLIDMGYPPEECEKVLEELVKKGAIEVCEVQIGRYGKKTLLRLKGGKRGEGREGD